MEVVGSADKLRSLVNGVNGGEKMKFAVRIFNCLNFAIEHPHLIPEIGVCWCRDGHNFFCNTSILANFLNLKRNSLNTNLRSHGFTHQTIQISEVTKDYPFINDFRNWRRCGHSSCQFSRTTPIKDIENIPCRPNQIMVTGQPSIIQRFPIDTTNKEQLLSLMSKVGLSIERKEQIVELIKQLWITMYGNSLQGRAETLIEAITKYASDFSRVPVLRENIAYLLSEFNEFSQSSLETINVMQFASFTLQYGTPSHACRTLEELSDFKGNQSPSFREFFRPGISAPFAQSIVRQSNKDLWILRPSSNVSFYTIHKGDACSKIQFDCLAGTFGMETMSGKVEKESIHELLFNTLQLTLPVEETVVADIPPSIPLQDCTDCFQSFSPLISASQFSYDSQVFH